MTLELPPLETLDIDGPVAYRIWEGPSETTFVLVHGLGGSSLSWVQVAPGLAGLGRVIALDLPGFGRSPRMGRGTTLMRERHWLSRFLDAATDGPVILAGNSMGGIVSLLEAAVEPERVGGVVLTSSVFPLAHGSFPHPIVLGSFAAYDLPRIGEAMVKARRSAVDPESFVRLGLRMLTVDPTTIPDEVIALHADLISDLRSDPEAPGAFLEAARSINTYARSRELGSRAMSNTACPVLVIHGRNDRFVPVGNAMVALRTHPAWRGRLLTRVGHLPQMEAPSRWLTEVADWYAAALR
ncbi:MAG: alpha/beta hydrolase [Actinomycetota bacterium]